MYYELSCWLCGGDERRGGRVTEIDNELKDLKPCDPFFPPDADPAGALEVVPLHEHVDEQVQSDGYPGYGRVAC